jgi:type I restriction enzyme S subunit
VLRATNITGAALTFDELVYVPAENVSAEQLLHPGDVVIASSSGSKEIVGKSGAFAGTSFVGSFGAFCTGLRPSSSLSRIYFGFYFQTPSYRKSVSDLSAGSNINNLKTGDLASQRFPLAPRAEQTRIVAKLEELLSDLDAGVAELKAAQKKLAQYRQSLLKAAVEGTLTAEWRTQHTPTETGAQLLERILAERRARWEARQLAKFKEQGKTPPKDWQKKYPEPVPPDRTGLPALPQGWVWASVDQLSESVRNGLSKTPNTDQRGSRIFKINAVRPMAVNFAAIKHIEIEESEAADYWVEKGDVLATRYNGSVDLLGVFGMVREVRERTLHPDKLIRMKPMTGAGLGAWMEVCGNVGASRKHLLSRVKTTAGQTGISGEDLKKTPIPLASALEQEVALAALDERLESIKELERPVELALKQSTAQRQNILRAAFAGQLVPQDPNDEPASVLLARIRAERAARDAVKKPRGGKIAMLTQR